MKAVLDTNIYVDYARGRQDVVDLLAIQSTDILLPSIVMGEFFYGFTKGSRPEYNEEQFHRFVTALEVSIIHVDEEVARKYAVIYSALSIKGARIPINDVWIAACCMSVGGTLLTRNHHFEQVDQIDKVVLPQ